MRVAKKMAFVTGGASGLGRASSLMLAKEGAKVAVSDVNAEGAKVADLVVAPVGHVRLVLVLCEKYSVPLAVVVAGVAIVVVVEVEPHHALLGHRAFEVVVLVRGHEELSAMERRVVHVRPALHAPTARRPHGTALTF